MERKSAKVSMGCDHRVLNGATVTRFVQQWRLYVEQPFLLLARLK